MSKEIPIYLNRERYDYYDGFCIDRQTGERMNTANVTAPVGSSHRTPAQQEAYKKIKEIADYKEKRRSANRELGSFYFASRNNSFCKLTPETRARLVYLCTYLDFDNGFKWKRNRKIKKSDLQDVLKLSRGTAFKFWKEVSPLYLVEEKDSEALKLVNTDFVRGNIINLNRSYERFFVKFIRKLYEETDATRHRHLGYIFGVLPYINTEYNILCWNPEERDIENIEALTVNELCDLIGCYKGDAKSLMDKYSHISFTVGDHQEYFLSYVANSSDYGGAKLFVNPKVLYSGSDRKRVEVLGAFTKRAKTSTGSDYLEHAESA